MDREITELILHYSESDIPAHDDISVIDGWHKARKFKCTLSDGKVIHVGYHYFITKSGEIQSGRPEDKIGAHCYRHNTRSIGICLHGDENFTENQFKSLANLLRDLLKRYPDATIHGHNEFSNKKCPNFDVDDFMEKYFSNVDEIIVNA